jgi:hypothetical protein
MIYINCVRPMLTSNPDLKVYLSKSNNPYFVRVLKDKKRTPDEQLGFISDSYILIELEHTKTR